LGQNPPPGRGEGPNRQLHLSDTLGVGGLPAFVVASDTAAGTSGSEVTRADVEVVGCPAAGVLEPTAGQRWTRPRNQGNRRKTWRPDYDPERCGLECSSDCGRVVLWRCSGVEDGGCCVAGTSWGRQCSGVEDRSCRGVARMPWSPRAGKVLSKFSFFVFATSSGTAVLQRNSARRAD